MQFDEFDEFFKSMTGHDPYPYQKRLAESEWPDVLNVPTGLGKTAAVVVAWVWKRGQAPSDGPSTPRRLVYCLPMRTLVEQTYENVRTWLMKKELLGEPGEGKISVHVLMGGSEDVCKPVWASYPEEEMVLVGTQDMLLSRALMRGYGMSRYQWPVHFALLHNDALWVFDEVQLMGSGLGTACQLEAFRRTLGTAAPARSLWVSATVSHGWMNTIDFSPFAGNLNKKTLEQEDKADPCVRKRVSAIKYLKKSQSALSVTNSKGIAASLANEILKEHQRGTTTLVIVNTVERAQELFKTLQKKKDGPELLLIHSRFRPQDRRELNRRLGKNPSESGRVVVATQAVEAGVDISSRTLFTELAPWPSLVQRFGRCNRFGECLNGGRIYWIDITDETYALPYAYPSLEKARKRLENLQSVSPSDLEAPDEEEDLLSHHVLRSKDFWDLFNTDPDLSGFDLDVSPYIRDADEADVQVFWRNLSNGVQQEPPPHRDELCRASLGQMDRYFKRRGEVSAYRWDSLSRREGRLGSWVPWRRDQRLRPGLVLMLESAQGGYSSELGFDPALEDLVPLTVCSPAKEEEHYDSDWRSLGQKNIVPLAKHLDDVEAEIRSLCHKLNLTQEETNRLAFAARWHDVGKIHPVFQETVAGCLNGHQNFLAKSPCSGRHARAHFRHELVSLLAWLHHSGTSENCLSPDETDFVAYLIAAHHGKIRLGLRAMPEEDEPTGGYGPRFARGVWEGDEVPNFTFSNGDVSQGFHANLELMELGESKSGPSWIERTHRLLKTYGPFRLAWYEALVRIADWRVSSS